MSRAKQFHVGDVVRVIWAKPGCEHFVGRTCRVTSEAFPHPCAPWWMMHHLDLEPDPGYTGCMAAEEQLELVYDGNRSVSWDQCAWRPLDVNLPDDTDTLPVHLRDPFAVIERGNFLLANGIPSKRPTVETDTYDEELRRRSSGPQAS